MKITKRKEDRPKPWVLDCGKINGKRRREFFETEWLAKEAMRAKRDELRGLPVEMCSLPNNKRIDFMEAERRLERIGLTLVKAVEYCEKTWRNVEAKTVAEAVADCIKSREQSGKRAEYLEVFKRRMKRLNARFDSRLCSTVTTEELEQWAREDYRPAAKQKPLSLATVKSRIIDARTLFSFCVKRKWITESPADGLQKIQTDGKPPGIHSVDDVGRLLEYLRKFYPDLLGYVAPIYFGGVRPFESRALTAANIVNGMIEVTPDKAKTRRRRFIPINDTLAAWLAVPGAAMGMQRRCRRLDTAKGKLALPWPHDVMRHSFCSYGLPVFGAQKIAEWAGHSETILFAHYRERVTPEAAKEFWALRPK